MIPIVATTAGIQAGEGWAYAAVVLDVYSRRVVGWSIADHLRTELVADALDEHLNSIQQAGVATTD